MAVIQLYHIIPRRVGYKLLGGMCHGLFILYMSPNSLEVLSPHAQKGTRQILEQLN